VSHGGGTAVAGGMAASANAMPPKSGIRVMARSMAQG
jgi:hypothetical protein